MNRYLIVLVMTLMISACAKDNEMETVQEQLKGSWALESAKRNNQETFTLAGAELEFVDQQTLISNLSGSRERLNYTLEGQSIVTKGSRMSQELVISSLTDSILNIQVDLGKFIFDLRFRKKLTQ